MTEKENSSSSNELKVDTATSVYHIYHTGTDKKHPNSYSIHSVRDSNTTILPKVEHSPSNIDSEEHLGDQQPIETPPPKPLKGAKRTRVLDNPEYDPRTENAPFFVHLPSLFGHDPPYTLRNGGHKRAPVACLLHAAWRWKGWRLEFGDILAQEGVVDGRGVLNARYGTKDGKDGMFKGYKIREKRYWGESGKAWWKEQKAQGFPEGGDYDSEGKAKPEEVITLRWTSPFSLHTRNHCFSWRGFDFVWKGTRKVESKKSARPFLFCNHLKLVVLVPDDASSVAKDTQKTELCLARYACVIGQRKAGRLELYQEVIDSFLSDHVFPAAGASPALDAGDGEEESPGERTLGLEAIAKTQKRIRDVVVGTSICMIMSEREKRRFLLEILLALTEFAE
jgi:hypothetical protein